MLLDGFYADEALVAERPIPNREGSGSSPDGRANGSPGPRSLATARGLQDQKKEASPGFAVPKKRNIRSLSKSSRAIPPRGVSLNTVALTLCAFFIFAVLASCIAANGRRGGDSFRPQEIR